MIVLHNLTVLFYILYIFNSIHCKLNISCKILLRDIQNILNNATKISNVHMYIDVYLLKLKVRC